MKPTVEYANLASMGSMAKKLLAVNGDFNALRLNGTLQKDEWKKLDETVLEAARMRLIGVADLLSMGLTYNIPNGLGVMTLEWERSGTFGPPTVSMSALAPAQRDRVTFDLEGLPLPVTMSAWGMELRVLMASRQRGIPLDMANAAEAGRSIAEATENMLFNGSGGFTFAGNTIYGYCDHPRRHEWVLSGDWGDPDDVSSGEPIIEDILAGILLLQEAHFYGPYTLYVPTAYGVRLSDDYKKNSDKAIITRIREIPQIRDVRTADMLTANNAVLVQMTSDVVRMVNGQELITVDWEGEGGFELNYKTLTIAVPQIRADKNGNCGVAHGTQGG